MQKYKRGRPVVKRDPNYEPTYKELMRLKYAKEWDALTPELRELADEANDLAELYGFTQ